MASALACGETYFSAGVLGGTPGSVGDGDGDGDGEGAASGDGGGDGDETGDGDGDMGGDGDETGMGGDGGSGPRPPGSVDLDPLGTIPFDYLDCNPPVVPPPSIPPGGNIVSADNIIFYSDGQSFPGTFTGIQVSGQDFNDATRVRIIGTPPMTWGVQMVRNTPTDIEMGEALLADAWARCETPLPGKDVCQALLIFEDAISYDKAVQFPIVVGSEWQQFFVALRAPQDYPVGVGHTTLFLGYSDQTIDIGPVTLRSYGTAADLADLPSTPLTYPGIEPDATWRAAASARIEETRRGDIDVSVVDSQGEPVSSAELRVRMLKHEFLFGSAVASDMVIRDSDPLNSERYIEEATRLFNVVTPFDAMKWKPWAGDWGSSWSKERGAEMLAWAETEDLAFRAHALVSPTWPELPEFLEGLAGDPPALSQAILAHIDEAMEVTRGRVRQWDVLYRAHTNRDLMNVLGDEVVVDWFERARAGDPDVKLFMSDFGILADGPGTNGHHATMDRFVEILEGAPLDGLAFTSAVEHILTGPEDIYSHLEHFGTDLGKELAISEYSIHLDDPHLAACYTHDFMTTIFSHPSVSTFLMWGFWSDEDLIFENDWTQKLSGRVYEDLVLQRWWTDDTVVSDSAGSARVRGFFGDYEITATLEGRTQSVTLTHTRGAPSQVTITLPD